jgi:uncharacterized protein
MKINKNLSSRLKIMTVFFVIIFTMNSNLLMGQLKYLPANEQVQAGMGVDRVAMLFTETYESKLAPNDNKIVWVQIDLRGKKKINGIKLLPKLKLVDSYVTSIGFPTRFKIEVSDDSTFKNSSVYEDYTRKDFKDPFDEIITFLGKEIYGSFVRLTAIQLRQQRLAFTKFMVISDGKDIAEGCNAKDSDTPNTAIHILTRPQRPQGEGVFTDNPENIIPSEKWLPVAYKANIPTQDVQLSGGIFKKTMDNNVEYLMYSLTFEELIRNFYLKAGRPVKPLQEKLTNFWMLDIPGSEAGRFLMGAGNTLRWMENEKLRNRMDSLINVIDECKEPDGYLMAYSKNNIFNGEYGAFTRAWVTHGLIDAGYAGNKKAFPLLRGFYDWFDNSTYLPELLRRGGQGTQGLIANTRMYFTPVGKPKDIEVGQRYFQENYWLKQLANKDPEAIWRYPYDRPHCYLITGIEPYLDIYRATGATKYLDAALGGWDLFHDNWEHIGGSIAICEDAKPYPPKSYFLHRGTGELCGSVFWSYFNQRLHLLYPEQEKYVTEIEKTIYNVLIANQFGSKSIRYIANLGGHKGHGDCTNTCCEGQGTRMMGALPEFIYTLTDDGVSVDLFAASKIKFTTKKQGVNMSLNMTTEFPYKPEVKIVVNVNETVKTNVRIRVPAWSEKNMIVIVNGKKAANGTPGSYLQINRLWKDGDSITFELPISFKITKYVGQDTATTKDRYALEYGPILMAYVNLNGVKDKFNLPASPGKLIKSLIPVAGKPLHFTINGQKDFEYVPYFDIKEETFACFPTVD